MVALHYLKYAFNLIDADVVEGWVENPYWQGFSSMKVLAFNGGSWRDRDGMEATICSIC
jgi:hypothetical protein